MAENAVQNAEIPSIYIIRPRAVYGEHDRILLPRIENSFKNGKMTIPGNLEVKSSLTNIQNILEVIHCALLEKKKAVSIYNVADSKLYILRDVFTKVGLLNNKKVKFKQVPVWLTRSLVIFCTHLKIPISFSQQSIEYITHESTLDTSKVKENLKVKLDCDFDEFVGLLNKCAQ